MTGHHLRTPKRANVAVGVSFATAMALCVLVFHFRLASSTSIPLPALACTYIAAVVSAGAIAYALGRWYAMAPRLWSAETVLLPTVILALAALFAAATFLGYRVITGEEAVQGTSLVHLVAIVTAAAWAFVLTSWPAIVPTFVAASVLSYRAHHPGA